MRMSPRFIACISGSFPGGIVCVVVGHHGTNEGIEPSRIGFAVVVEKMLELFKSVPAEHHALLANLRRDDGHGTSVANGLDLFAREIHSGSTTDSRPIVPF